MHTTDHYICTYLTCVFFNFQINLIILLLVIRIMLVAVNAIPPSGQKSQNASIRYTQTTTRLALDESSLVITMRVAKTPINSYQNLNSKWMSVSSSFDRRIKWSKLVLRSVSSFLIYLKKWSERRDLSSANSWFNLGVWCRGREQYSSCVSVHFHNLQFFSGQSFRLYSSSTRLWRLSRHLLL